MLNLFKKDSIYLDDYAEDMLNNKETNKILIYVK